MTRNAEPLRADFKRFPWVIDPAGLEAWRRGRTGFPIIDAGMRELWTTGWMHNRVRMIVASFLVKDLLIDWREGAAWFWDTLVDADLANNTLGWQWTSGCGADAAPYFRIFNPAAQGAKFDPEGDYARRWCPELARLPAKWIHQPDRAPQDVLREAGVEIQEARISYLAYAPEIAAAMLQRQQAGAIVAARAQIVAGAVGMVEHALQMLAEKQIIELDPERRAAMVSNLLVVLCGHSTPQPILNTGTLYN